MQCWLTQAWGKTKVTKEKSFKKLKKETKIIKVINNNYKRNENEKKKYCNYGSDTSQNRVLKHTY